MAWSNGDVSPVRLAELARWLEVGPDLAAKGVVCWCCANLVAKIAAEFGVAYLERGVAVLSRRLGFRYLSARPQAPKADAAGGAADIPRNAGTDVSTGRW